MTALASLTLISAEVTDEKTEEALTTCSLAFKQLNVSWILTKVRPMSAK
jgi:hypothetical protein